MLPAPIWPLAEHASFGQNCCDASIGSVVLFIIHSMPLDACFFQALLTFSPVSGELPRDAFGTFFRDEDFLDLFSEKGQPAESAWRLALVMVMQYAEGLTDRQAADAVRTRIDWKYALSLEITDPGFDFVRHVTWQPIADAIGT